MTIPASPAVDPAVAIVDPAVVADPALATAPDANAVDPSPAEPVDAKEPANLLSIVKSAIAETAEPPASSAEEVDPVVDPAAAVEAPADAAAEDDANLPFHNHPRWKAVIAERDSFKEPAEKYGIIEGFMQEHKLSSEEVAQGYSVMAALKSGDPELLAEAREYFANGLSHLDGLLGNVLPEDLKLRVDEGFLDEEGAQEVARSRAAAALLAAKDTATAAAQAADRERSNVAEITNTVATAVQGWEERTKAADPDYAKKADLVLDRCMSLVNSGRAEAPTTAEAAIALADRAYAEITATFKAALPKARAIDPTPAGSVTVSAAAPKNLGEAIRQRLNAG